MDWELHYYTPEDTKSWDDFVLSQPDGSIHQVSKWKTFQEQISGREQVLGFYATNAQNQWIGATWCVKMSTGFFDTHWYYSARGPVLTKDDSNFKAEFLEAVTQKLKIENGLFWRLDPYWKDSEWAQVVFPTKAATKNFQPTDCLMLDLTLNEEALLAQMKRHGRKALRLAGNAGVTVRCLAPEKVTEEDLDHWQALNQDTTKRDGFAGHDRAYYQNFIRTLAPYTTLCLAEHEGRVVAAAILTICDRKAIYYFGASSSDPSTRDLRAPYALQWAMIKHAKAQGATTYDFTGITPEDQPDHPYKGITQFKTRFGGYRDTYAAGREIVLRPKWYALYRLVKKLKA